MAKKACHSELVSETNKGGESLPLARTSSLATPSSGGHPRNAPVDTSIEAPYELPEGWKWTRLGDCSSVISKGTTPKGGKDAYLKEGVNFLRIENLNEDGSINLSNISHISIEEHEGNLKRSILEEGDLLISIAGTLGKVGFVTKADLPMNTNQAIAFIRLHKDIFDNMYLKYAIESPFVNAELLAKTKVTSIPNLTLEIISNCLIPLPPTLAEQQRIVNRIETMFAKLDQAQEKAQAVLDSFENRKAAILHKAFTGELTANWRKENAVSDESWEEKTLNEVCSKEITDGTHKTPTYVDEHSGVPFISGKDVSNEVIDWSDLRYIPQELHEELYTRLAPQKDDVLLSKNGARLGKAAIVETDIIFDIYVTLALLRPNQETILSKYLWRIINSPVIQTQIQDHLTGIGMPNLHLRDIKIMKIPVPELPEQQEIVRILDTVLEKESRAKEAAQAVLDQIALLKKSILARAFRGEL